MKSYPMVVMASFAPCLLAVALDALWLYFVCNEWDGYLLSSQEEFQRGEWIVIWAQDIFLMSRLSILVSVLVENHCSRRSSFKKPIFDDVMSLWSFLFPISGSLMAIGLLCLRVISVWVEPAIRQTIINSVSETDLIGNLSITTDAGALSEIDCGRLTEQKLE